MRTLLQILRRTLRIGWLLASLTMACTAQTGGSEEGPPASVEGHHQGDLWVEGTTSGIFVEPRGPSGMWVDGMETDRFTWGRPLDVNDPANELIFQGETFSAKVGEVFTVGRLTFGNAVTTLGTQAEGVILRMVFTWSAGFEGKRTQRVSLRLTSTPNGGGGSADADSLLLTSPFEGDLLEIDGQLYGLKLSFGAASAHGFSEVEQLYVLEERAATVRVRAQLVPAIPLALDTTGIFADPRGPEEMRVTGVGTSRFTWGTASDAVGVSELGIEGGPVAGHTERWMVLGSMTFFNGTIRRSTGADGVDLRLTLRGAADEKDPGELSVPLELESTPNGADPGASADRVHLAISRPPPVVRIGGIDYALRLQFGRVSGRGYSDEHTFSVEEGHRAQVELWGVFSRVLPAPRFFDVRVRRRESQGLLLTWPSTVGRRYEVEMSTDLQRFEVLSGVITATATTMAYEEDPPWHVTTFYRVRELP